MKAEIKNEEIIDFKPFDLVIKVESLDDLKFLWHLHNISYGVASGFEIKYKATEYIINEMYLGGDVFNVLNNKLKELTD